jgi:hypothetical protein
MSKPWNPQDELLRVREDRDSRAQSGPRWPDGATAGLVMLGLGCFAVAMLLYRLAGPRDVFGS